MHVYLFKDRLEIVRPGGLPAGMTEADLGTKSIPRNPSLFAMLHRMEAVEHIGSGIKRIRNLCREYGVAEPKIEVSEHWFTMVFPRPDLPEGGEQAGTWAEGGRDQVKAQADQVGPKSGPSQKGRESNATQSSTQLPTQSFGCCANFSTGRNHQANCERH
ncbi:hypothetical protein JCM31598_31540 [Desulfonatronum parangueonense]